MQVFFIYLTADLTVSPSHHRPGNPTALVRVAKEGHMFSVLSSWSQYDFATAFVGHEKEIKKDNS